MKYVACGVGSEWALDHAGTVGSAKTLCGRKAVHYSRNGGREFRPYGAFVCVQCSKKVRAEKKAEALVADVRWLIKDIARGIVG